MVSVKPLHVKRDGNIFFSLLASNFKTDLTVKPTGRLATILSLSKH